MNAKTTALGLCCLAVVVLGGCNDEKRPAKPPIGAQIERMGRAGVNTAVTAPFAALEVHDRLQDEYNQASNDTQWVGLFSPEFQGNLAILDSLDRTCGNQLLAGPAAAAGRYAALANVLADDRLYVNTASGNCGQYLAVEANAIGVTNSDCGGRTPLYDTIDTTYSVFAIGGLSGVNDDIPVDADGNASTSAFPFLDTPN